MTLEEQKKVVEEILGLPLPELDSIYYEGSPAIMKMSPNTYITPYLLHELFTVEEMRMVSCLPATAAEVANRLGIDEQRVEKVLSYLQSYGRIIDNGATVRCYSPHTKMVTFRDTVAGGLLWKNADWTPYLKGIRLMEQWIRVTPSPELKIEEDVLDIRCIPKWESIKDIPGVMHCENMKEIFEEHAKKGEVAANLCVCRAIYSYSALGRYDPEYCNAKLGETDSKHGHCFAFGAQAKFFSESMGTQMISYQEAMARFEEAEKSECCYSTGGVREVATCCTCCQDCCAVTHYENEGVHCFKPSRFRPECNSDKCVGCGKCERTCHFGAVRIVDNKAVIDKERCKGCGNCVVKCPTKALKMKIVHEPDWIPDVPYVNDWALSDENQ